MKYTAEEKRRFDELTRSNRVQELAEMVISLERALDKRQRVSRGPKPSKRVIYTLSSCFGAADAGGFNGDTDDVTPAGAEAAEKWLDAWKAIFADEPHE